MTNEEAIEILCRELGTETEDKLFPEVIEARDMTIKALSEERKTMTHEEAVGFLQESGWLQDHDRQIYEQGKRDGIEWHPYPKEKPSDGFDNVYLVTRGYGENHYVDIGWHDEFGWHEYNREANHIYGVTAWAEKPERYEEGAKE